MNFLLRIGEKLDFIAQVNPHIGRRIEHKTRRRCHCHIVEPNAVIGVFDIDIVSARLNADELADAIEILAVQTVIIRWRSAKSINQNRPIAVAVATNGRR